MRMEMREREKFEEGLETGIRGTVSALKKLNIPIQKILEMLQEEYNLTLDVAKKYV